MIFRWLTSSTARTALAAHKHYRRLLAAQRDVLSPQASAPVQAKLDELRAAIEEGHTGRINLKAGELQFAAEKWLKPYPHAAWRENVEVLLVALAVAMGIRTFFLQPFKIPTSSMQPTLFGVVSTPNYDRAYLAGRSGYPEAARAEFAAQARAQAALVIPTGWERVKQWFQGRSYVHVVAQADGTVDPLEFGGKVTRFLIFNLWQTFSLGGVSYTLWFPPDCGEEDLQYRAGLLPGRAFRKGDDLIKIRVDAGDHLFVDRMSYNFHKPERGDIIVFATAGIPEDERMQNNIPGDQFYIKRLVGLPGEKVSIGDDRHVRVNGQRLDAATPHFENVYGFDPAEPPRESQWSGHLNGTVAQKYGRGNLPKFPDEQTVFAVPAGSCLPMGDNTCVSLDSRYWGSIPEQYVFGRAFFVYWPLTGRFGCGDR